MIEHCVQFFDEFNRDSNTQFSIEEAIEQLNHTDIESTNFIEFQGVLIHSITNNNINYLAKN